MKKKLIIIAGQTGVGKTEIANNLAAKINGEIIILDTIQCYKEFNISSNKPSINLQKMAKYHNLNIYDAKDSKLNSMIHAQKIRNLMNQIWQENKTPILEGGCAFLLKTLLTGASFKRSDEEENGYRKALLTAEKLIEYDSDFNKCIERLLKIDPNFPQNKIMFGCKKRLSNHLANAIILGNNSFYTIEKKEKEIRIQNQLPACDIYKFFFYKSKLVLYQALEDRCENMLDRGLLEEIRDLIKNKIINADNYNNFNFNAYGIKETINYFLAILAFLPLKKIILSSFNNGSKRDSYQNDLKKTMNKTIYEYLSQFSFNNKHYAKHQVKFFKNTLKDFIWIRNDIKDSEFYADKLIKEFISLSYIDYNNLINTEEYIFKDEYDSRAMTKYIPKFNIFTNKPKFIKFLENSFSIVETIEKELIKLQNINYELKEEIHIDVENEFEKYKLI